MPHVASMPNRPSAVSCNNAMLTWNERQLCPRLHASLVCLLLRSDRILCAQRRARALVHTPCLTGDCQLGQRPRLYTRLMISSSSISV